MIIPIYKVEKYLCECIDSVINQTHTDLQIILVDDGSPDLCGKICDDYSMRDNRIHVIHKQNGGLSDARNAGIKQAKGEFIYYLDSDDYIELNTIEILLDEQRKTNADIVISNYYYTYTDYENIAKSFYKEKIILDNYDAMKSLVSGKLQTFAWGKLIRTDLAKKYLFPKGKLFEDHYWTHYLFGDAECICYITNTLVHYRQRNNSISYIYDLKRLDVLDGWIDRKEYLEKYYPDLIEECMEQYSEKYIGIAWQILTRMKKKKKIGFQKMRLLNNSFQLQNFTFHSKRRLICMLDKSIFLYGIWAVFYKVKGEN